MVLTQADIDELKNIFATKEDLVEFKSDILNHVDKILQEIIASRQEQKILSHKVYENHEKRITSLEEIHPEGKHASALVDSD